MSKRILTIIFVISLTTSCFGTSRALSGEAREVLAVPERVLRANNVYVGQSQILPPYGVRVLADQASLTIRVSTSSENATARLSDIQNAVEQIASQAAENDRITLGSVSVSQIEGSVERSASDSNIKKLDSSAVTLNLTTDLTEQHHDLVETFVIFNNFLNDLDVPETIMVEVLSVATEISNTEMYRPQLVAKVYQELDAIRQEYGQSVKFSISGLHGNIQMMQLTDTEFYLYIQPSIMVNEF